MKKIMISGTSSGVGKTTITLGIMAALKQKGLTVQPFKVGPDYIDTSYQSKITGKRSRNLDSYLVREEAVLSYLFNKEGEKADISVVEGAMGLYDGFGIDKDFCSSSAMAKQLKLPVILVVDGKSSSTSVAAVIKGFIEFDKDVKIEGVIINRVASDNHFSLIKGSIEKYTNVAVLGYLPKNAMTSLPSRQLGLVPEREVANSEERFNKLGELVSQTIDLDKLIKIASSNYTEKPVEQAVMEQAILPFYEKRFPDLTVAYALDAAFHFYYQDNLDLLEKKGVTLIPFSPLQDQKLPEADAYYIGGGYPEEYGEELAENKVMLTAIRKKHQEGRPIYAECGGLMYLGSQLELAHQTYEMVGIFSGKSYMTKGLKRFGYSQGWVEKDCLIAPRGSCLYGHEFHHSLFESQEPAVLRMEKWRDGKKIDEWSGGYYRGRTFASYLHLHFYQNPQLLDYFLEKVVASRDESS